MGCVDTLSRQLKAQKKRNQENSTLPNSSQPIVRVELSVVRGDLDVWVESTSTCDVVPHQRQAYQMIKGQTLFKRSENSYSRWRLEYIEYKVGCFTVAIAVEVV